MALPSILTFGVFGTLASFAIISLFLYVALGFALFKLEVRHRALLWDCRGRLQRNAAGRPVPASCCVTSGLRLQGLPGTYVGP